ncbi:hypothetical protein SAMN05421509_10747 [Chromohalobacter canadensis]|uniref:Uncharacterized protein n=1 Tax=Chromohalobacter canadensis TaxID=141389 RepID=A0A285VUY7_9GAMM|nr:hypothetical protein [Chromohalobacter canadensis]SOC56451.1 hypothetical protein SAMN05421509_10747 [Chromohalobacter canadensis]
MPHTTDTAGRAWHIEHTEPTGAGIDVHYGYPADAPRTGPPRVADTPELVAYLWRVSMQDAMRTLPIGEGALRRIRQRHGITRDAQRMAASARERDALAAKPAALITPNADHHDATPSYAAALVNDLSRTLSRAAIGRRAGIDYTRVLELAAGAAMTYPEQFTLERLRAGERLDWMRRDDAPPTPGDVAMLREGVGLSKRQAADAVFADIKSWRAWEEGKTPMPLAKWALFQYRCRDLR